MMTPDAELADSIRTVASPDIAEINVNPLNGKTLKRKITFTADFAYLEEGAAPPGHPLVPGKIALVPGLVVEDVKPWRRGRPITTRDYMLKKALMFVCHGIEVIEVQA